MGTSELYSAPGPAEALALRHGDKAAVRAALLQARERTLALAADYAAALGASQAVPYAAERNPPLWEQGHLAWFQEWWIARNPQRALGIHCHPDVPRSRPLLPAADSWYDSSRVAHRSRWQLPLPDADGTREYLERTLDATLAHLDALSDQPGDRALYFFRLCALHEQMHAEAATYMAHGLGIPLRDRPRPIGLPSNEELFLPAQQFELGSERDGFAFDNELPRHQRSVGPAWIDAQVVTWERFLPFVEAGGYEDARWWSDAGAAWLSRAERRGPPDVGTGDQPATHLSAHEAEAWCRWAGRRLLTEAEWECAALTLPGFQWGAAWEWTSSAFEPYPGFVAHPYRDYSQPWFGSRRVLRGASPATSPWLAHARYRNFFEPHRHDVGAGFRSSRT